MNYSTVSRILLLYTQFRSGYIGSPKYETSFVKVVLADKFTKASTKNINQALPVSFYKSFFHKLRHSVIMLLKINLFNLSLLSSQLSRFLQSSI